MKPIYFIAVLLLSAAACHPRTAPQPDTYNNDSVQFFPVRDYLIEQVKAVDSVPYFIYHITQTNGSRDSAAINREQFNQAVAVFTQYDITDSSVKKYYKESVFSDESTHSYTLHYATNNTSLPVQSIDVLLKPEDQHVKRIFITTIQNRNDTTILTRLGWKANESCSINTSISHAGKEQQTQTTIVWNE